MNNNQLTTNFHLREFKCNDGTEVPCELLANVGVLAAQLQVLRDYTGAAIYINSAYRTEDYNKKIGGANESQHLLAKASDITTKMHTPKQLAKIVEKLIKEGKMKIGGIGIYPGFLHIDTRDIKARW